MGARYFGTTESEGFLWSLTANQSSFGGFNEWASFGLPNQIQIFILKYSFTYFYEIFLAQLMNRFLLSYVYWQTLIRFRY
jgi:hypothetical protein